MEMTYFRKDGSAFFYFIFVNYEVIFTSLNAVCGCGMRCLRNKTPHSAGLSPKKRTVISNTTEKSRVGGLHKLRKGEQQNKNNSLKKKRYEIQISNNVVLDLFPIANNSISLFFLSLMNPDLIYHPLARFQGLSLESVLSRFF